MELQAIQNQALIRPADTAPVRKVGDAGSAEAEKNLAPAAKAPSFDEYIPEDPTVKQSAGIYAIIHDDDGTPRVQFDDPEKEKSAPESKAETTTCNTDDVDREIEGLRKDAEALEQQLRAAADKPEEAEKLERELARVQQELRQKDNDGYRRQHADFS